MRGSILVYGNDPTLLYSRKKVLESAGFRVADTTRLADTQEIIDHADVDLLILGSNLAETEVEKVLYTTRHWAPWVKVLVLSQRAAGYKHDDHIEVLETFAAPETLVEMARKLVVTPHSYAPAPMN